MTNLGVTLKSPFEIERMKAAGLVVEETLKLMESLAKPGITTAELDRIADEFIRSRGAEPSFLGYQGYPKSICTSVNAEVVHGIPGKRRLQEGDIVSVDVGAKLNGFQGDAARTFLVGEVSPEVKKLVRVTRECFFEGLKYAVEGNHICDISKAIEAHAQSHGYGVVRELVGHGIGREMHEPPEVPNFYDRRFGKGAKLVAGMTIAMEPMINMGKADVVVLENGWTVEAKDGRPSAHYENTIAITDGAPLLLTLTEVQ